MILIFVLTTWLPTQQLTWYETYERGEKAFHRQQYQECVLDMNAALLEKPTPGRNLFTRAVQKIDYKPYYYLALSYFHLGDLPQAFEYAQKSFGAEVVGQTPPLQADLGQILIAYRSWVEKQHQRYTREIDVIQKRSLLIEQLNQGRVDDVADFLASTPDPESYRDIQGYLDLRQDWEKQQDTVQNRLLIQLETWLSAGETEKARTLFTSLRANLSAGTIAVLEERFRQVPPPEEAVNNEEPNALSPDGTAEQVSDPTPTVDPGLVEFYKKELEKVQLQKTSLDERVASFSNQNQELRRELENNRNPTTFQPQLFLTLSSQVRSLKINAHGVSPLQISNWQLRLNGRVLNIPESAMIRDGVNMRLEYKLNAPDYGQQELVFSVIDELGREVSTRESLYLPVPWFLDRSFLIILAVILFSGFLFYLWIRLRRRKQARLRHFNPYIAGSPIRDEQMFYGRSGLLHRIQNLVHKNSFMIHGSRRIGKTSLLMQLSANLSQLDSPTYRFYPAFIDLQGITEEELFHHMMAEVANYSEEWGFDLEKLKFRDQFDDYQSRHFSKDIKTIIENLKSIQKKHVILVLLMDEVDVLNEFSEKTNQKLRGIFMKDFAEHLSCVMAGIHLKKEWESSGSPWYNFFEEIPVNPINEKAARKLILEPVKGIFKYDPRAVDQIINHTGGHPYLIQKLCVSLIGEKLKANRFLITSEDVKQAMAAIQEETVRSSP